MLVAHSAAGNVLHASILVKDQHLVQRRCFRSRTTRIRFALWPLDYDREIHCSRMPYCDLCCQCSIRFDSAETCCWSSSRTYPLAHRITILVPAASQKPAPITGIPALLTLDGHIADCCSSQGWTPNRTSRIMPRIGRSGLQMGRSCFLDTAASRCGAHAFIFASVMGEPSRCRQ